MFWDECPQALQEGFSILPILKRKQLYSGLCPLQRRRETTQQALRESTTSVVKIEGTFVSKNLDETVRLESEKRGEWIQETRGERLQRITEGASNAHHLAGASFLGRNECQATHLFCYHRRREKTVLARSAREIEVKGKTEDNTRWRGLNESQIGAEEMRNGRLAGAAETSKELAEWCRLLRKNMNILGLPKRRERPQCYKDSS